MIYLIWVQMYRQCDAFEIVAVWPTSCTCILQETFKWSDAEKRNSRTRSNPENPKGACRDPECKGHVNPHGELWGPPTVGHAYWRTLLYSMSWQALMMHWSISEEGEWGGLSPYLEVVNHNSWEHSCDVTRHCPYIEREAEKWRGLLSVREPQ